MTEQFNPSNVAREKVRHEFGFTGPTVLFAGTPRWHKGLKPLAKAVSKVAGARLAVLCRPEDLCEPQWQRYPLLRLPMISYLDFPKLLAAADLVAIPQLDTEISRHQMPMKVYDCMAMARPIVASAISDLPATLEGCGRLVPPGDVGRLAEAIADLLSHPEEAHALGERARARCLELYSMESVSDKLRSAVDRVLGSPSEN